MSAKPLSYEVALETANAWVSNDYSRNKAAKFLNISTPTMISRLANAQKYGIIKSTNADDIIANHVSNHTARQHITLENGIVVVGSDGHYWPDEIAPAHKVFVKVIKELQPKLVIQNGDVLDAPSVSRFSPIGWEDQPKLSDEIECCQIRLREIYDSCPKARKIWNCGNHDLRFETRLATVAPEFARVKGIHLKDHFPEWDTAWSTWINNDVVVKHRYKGGIHATHNNTLWSGKTMVTGHLHSLKVTPFSDYSGTRWGVDTGTLAKKYTPKFTDYTEDSPLNWISGFVVLTFYRSELLWPEVCHILDDHRYEFRGKVYKI